MTVPMQKTTPREGASHKESCTASSCIGKCNPLAYPTKKGGGIDIDRVLEMVRAGYSGAFAPWDLPATGRPENKCGRLMGTTGECLDCGHRWPVLISCKRPTCPRCGSSYVRRNAMAAAVRLRAVRATRVAEGMTIRRLMVSPPPDRWPAVFDGNIANARRAMTGLRRQAIDLAKALGMRGGAVGFHPGRDSEERWTFNVRGPHFHFTGFAAVTGPHRGDGGWVAKWGPKEYVPGPGLFNLLAYDLTHVGCSPNLPGLVWWGIAHHRVNPLPREARALIEALAEGVRLVCPECTSIHTRRTEATWEELGEWGFHEPVAHEKPRGPPRQHRFVAGECDDCGAEWMEPIPEKPAPWAKPILKPWHYREPRESGRR